MKPPLLLASFLAFSAGIAFAKSPAGDWQSVQDIPAGWQITVVTTFTYPCIFESADTDELTCRQLDRYGSGADLPEIHVPRSRVREIRVEKRGGANRLTAAGLGGGVGAGFGALAVPGARGPAAYLLGTMGAVMGARAGQNTHLLRGKVIYRPYPGTMPGKNRGSTVPQASARTSP
jgi:hypothetical protein